MTYKAAICELPYGGGKSVMIADPRRDKTLLGQFWFQNALVRLGET
jgi:glutamate dehydrogenase/leucine dehydrogenase